MTRATTTTSSHSSNHYAPRSNGYNRNFKKSRAPLTAISMNQNHRKSNLTTNVKSNPFRSFDPNTSGIISKEEQIETDIDSDHSIEPSDFSHFLSENPTPQKTIPSNTKNPQKNTNENIPNWSSSNFTLTDQSRSNHNLQINDSKNINNPNLGNDNGSDDLIFGALQRFNSMTVPFSNDTNANNNKETKQITQINHKHSLPYCPNDLCIKKSLYFMSNQSLNWCANIPLKIRNAAIHNIPLQSLQIDSDLEQKQYSFYKQMLYYKYPHNGWSAYELTSVHKFYMIHCSKLEPLQKYQNSDISHQFGIGHNDTNANQYSNDSYEQSIYNSFMDRLCEWMQSFHSIYGLFKQEFCRSFYIHFDTFFNIIFRYSQRIETIEGKEDKIENIPQIIITNTHQSFRNHLRKENIEFTTPLIEARMSNKENMNGFGDDINVEELKENGINVRINKKRRAQGYGFGYNNKDRSVTLIEGSANIHCFYDYLMNTMHRLCLSQKRCHDIPLIFCEKQFLNSKCCVVQMSKNVSGVNMESKQRMYTMQLNGHILPNVYKCVAELMAKWEQNVSVTSELFDGMSVGINYCANVPLFVKLKQEKNANFTSVNKIEVNVKEKVFVVYLQ